ncbi:MAG: RHS domain-containing protein, partial [Desulfobacula sp.]|nr:RHS domain-containing protein [Desulfobacula sp.]
MVSNTYSQSFAIVKPIYKINSQFDYDIACNLLKKTDRRQKETHYVYDDLNRKLAETINFGPFEKTLAYTWYKNNLKKTFTAPGSTTYQYAYNESNQLSGIEIPGLGTIFHGSYKWTRPETTLLPGGSSNTRTYDALMRTQSITIKDPGSNPIMEYSYTFDPMDNITAKTTEHGDYQYTYDNLYRLTESDNPEIPELADETFIYDPVGNRLTSSDTTGDWTYNNNNELETRDNTSYVYDANGNMTQKTVSGVVTMFFYNLEDRLERVETESGTIIAAYGYDPFGRRLWKEVSGTRTYYCYSDEGLIGEYDAAGTEIKAYGWKPGSTWGTDPLFMKIGTEYYFYHNDHLGTPQKMTAVNGAVVWSAKYSSFLKANVDPLSIITNNLRAGGQYYDDETGLHYNYQRYYDPIIGRYIKEDPIGFDGGINFYNYVFSNPTSLFDPYGLLSCNKDGSVCPSGEPSSPNEGAAAWAQNMFENSDKTNWKFYTSKYNGDNNRPQGYDRCNTFVWDSYRKGGKVPKSKIPKGQKYPNWPAFANDIADPAY